MGLNNNNFLINEKGILYKYTGQEKNITIPKDVIEIGDKAFSNCENLETITFNEYIINIGENIFEGCKSLKQVTGARFSTKDNYIFWNNDIVKYIGNNKNLNISIKNIKKIKGYAFSESEIENITILNADNETTELEVLEGAFKNCKKLKQVNFSSFSVSLEKEVFSGCSSLETIKAGNIYRSKKATEGQIFTGCKLLNTATSNTVIKNGFFIFRNKLLECFREEKNIVVPKEIKKVSLKAFNHDIETITFEGEIELFDFIDIKEYYPHLKNINGKNIKNENGFCIINSAIINSALEDNCLIYYTGQEEIITIDEKISKICNFAFAHNKYIKEIYINTELSKIGIGSFYDCKNLQKIKLPETLHSIASEMFKNCESLKEVILSKKIVKIDNESFKNCISLEEINSNVRKIKNNSFANCKSLKKIGLNNNDNKLSKGLSIVDSNFILRANKELEGYIGSKEDIVIPENVSIIPFNYFKGHNEIKSITIPASIKDIYENFSDFENLEKIIFKGTCSKISPSIFANCKNLKEIQGNEIFLKDGLIIENKTKIAGFTRPNEILRIPEGITEIKNGAFFFSFIKEIILPKSIEKIGDNAFYNCKRLKKITIPETIKEIGINIFLNCFSLEEIVNSHYFIKNNCIIHDGNLEYCFLSKNKIYIPDGTKYLNTRYLRYYHHTDEFDILLILPEGLKKLYIRNNFIDKINMKIKNVPESLTYVSTDSFDYLKSIFNNENLKKISKIMKLQEINKAILKSFIEESLKDEIFKDCKIQASEEAIKIYKNSQYVIYRYEDFDLQMINFDDFKKTLLNDLSKS